MARLPCERPGLRAMCCGPSEPRSVGSVSTNASRQSGERKSSRCAARYDALVRTRRHRSRLFRSRFAETAQKPASCECRAELPWPAPPACELMDRQRLPSDDGATGHRPATGRAVRSVRDHYGRSPSAPDRQRPWVRQTAFAKWQVSWATRTGQPAARQLARLHHAVLPEYAPARAPDHARHRNHLPPEGLQ